MVIIENPIIPFKGFIAVNILGILFVRKEHAHRLTSADLNHEAIHTAQMRELLYAGFYLLYALEWLWRVLFTRDRFTHAAYRSISFEREAYANEENLHYLNTRKHFTNFKHLKL